MNHHSTLTTIFLSIILLIVSLFSHKPITVSATSRLFIPPIQTTANPPSAAASPTPASSPSPLYKNLCNKTTYPTLCVSVVKSDRRETLKTSPAGLAVIVVDAAKRNIRTTTKFIEKHLMNNTDENTRTGLKNCKFGYGTVDAKNLDITANELDDPDRREDFILVLQNTDDEVSYDCQWYQPDPFPDLLQRMFNRVNSFIHMLEIARTMVDSMR